MDEIHQFDPAQGYVALPNALLDLDLAPGPFRLLIQLCKMANRDGECWPSLGQLSDAIGRSKAALSGYLNELRKAGLVETISQRMANGYNYRLKYIVTFWAKWRSDLSKPRLVGQQAERSVQPVECRVNSKKQIQKKHGCLSKSKTLNANLETVLTKWRSLTVGAPYPAFNDPVPSELRVETKALIAAKTVPELTPSHIETTLGNLWASQNVIASSELTKQQSEMLISYHFTEPELFALAGLIEGQWQPHWKKPPSEAQFEKMIVQARASAPEQTGLRLLRQFLRRDAFAEKALQRGSASTNVSRRCAA